ncbi:MAG: hypothetical protein HC831_07025 [Chloroflexia bacterium]|nr:hypothetical protein [Chloroflexia bacterium]
MENNRIIRQSRRGWKLLKNGKVERDIINYKEPDPEQVSGYGSPITSDLAEKIIQEYQNHRDRYKVKHMETCQEVEQLEYPDAFTIGKQSLLSILSQEGCEGIRFYLAEKKGLAEGMTGDLELNRWADGITLVAIGVKNPAQTDKYSPEIGVEKSLNHNVKINLLIEYLNSLLEKSEGDEDINSHTKFYLSLLKDVLHNKRKHTRFFVQSN